MTHAHADDAMTNHTMDDAVLDYEQFEEMRDLLEDDFIDLVQTYLTDSQARIIALRRAYADSDNTNGFEIAHALTGASANIGTTQLIVLGQQIQQVCRDNTLSQNGAYIDQLEAAFDRAKIVIHQYLGLS